MTSKEREIVSPVRDHLAALSGCSLSSLERLLLFLFGRLLEKSELNHMVEGNV